MLINTHTPGPGVGDNEGEPGKVEQLQAWLQPHANIMSPKITSVYERQNAASIPPSKSTMRISDLIDHSKQETYRNRNYRKCSLA